MDVDLLVEFDRPAELQRHLEDPLGCGLDPRTPQSLEPRIRDVMLTGSIAAGYYAQPPMTRDIDLVEPQACKTLNTREGRRGTPPRCACT